MADGEDEVLPEVVVPKALANMIHAARRFAPACFARQAQAVRDYFDNIRPAGAYPTAAETESALRKAHRTCGCSKKCNKGEPGLPA